MKPADVRKRMEQLLLAEAPSDPAASAILSKLPRATCAKCGARLPRKSRTCAACGGRTVAPRPMAYENADARAAALKRAEVAAKAKKAMEDMHKQKDAIEVAGSSALCSTTLSDPTLALADASRAVLAKLHEPVAATRVSVPAIAIPKTLS